MEYVYGEPKKKAMWNSTDIFSADSAGQLTRLK